MGIGDHFRPDTFKAIMKTIQGEGFHPRYIPYRCISGRERNGISCSLANKYYSGTKLETEVKEVISSMVTIPEFVELISQKIDIQTDVNSLRKKQTAIRNSNPK